MRRHGHDRTCAVTHHHIVRDPDRNLLTVHGIHRIRPCEDTGFIFVQITTIQVRLRCNGFLIDFNRRFIFLSRNHRNKRMLWRKNHVSSAEKRIRSGRENFDF